MNLDIIVKDPIVRGPLALFPLFSGAPGAPAYLTGPEAERAGVLTVTEHDAGAAVPELVVRNDAEVPVLLLEGETVIGAKQNRMLNVSVLVPARSKLAVPVSCVEAGRWGSARPTARSPRHAPEDVRRRNTVEVAKSRRAGAGARGNQGAVWDQVAAYQRAFAAPSATAALEDVYGKVDRDLRAIVDGLGPLPEQRGVLVAVGREVRGMDWFDKASTLAAYWEGLVQGYAIDALQAGEAVAAVADAEGFVRRVLDADITSEPAVGLGRERGIAGAGIAGHALEWERAVVHLAAFASADNRGPDRRARTIDRRRWFG
jgi:hypothetical protein